MDECPCLPPLGASFVELTSFCGKVSPQKWGGNFKTCRNETKKKALLLNPAFSPPKKPLRNTTQVVSIPRYDLWNLPPAAFEDDQLGNKGRVRNPFVRPNPPLRNSREISNVGAMVSLVDIKLMDSGFFVGECCGSSLHGSLAFLGCPKHQITVGRWCPKKGLDFLCFCVLHPSGFRNATESTDQVGNVDEFVARVQKNRLQNKLLYKFGLQLLISKKPRFNHLKTMGCFKVPSLNNFAGIILPCTK